MSYAQASLSISVSLNKGSFQTGEAVAISGRVSDPAGQPVSDSRVSIQVSGPQEQQIYVNLLYTDVNGQFADQFLIPSDAVAGTYTVFLTASKPGFSDGQEQISFTVVVVTQTITTVTTTTETSPTTTTTGRSTPCIIATATYGSELAPDVQFLREFRDRTVMSTFAGSHFMTLFNAWYYSFSPQVAAYIASNPQARSTAKVVLYPLIGILRVSTIAYFAFGFLPELAVVSSGIIASSMIGLVYVLPIVALLTFYSRRYKHLVLAISRIRSGGALWTTSLLAIVIAEVFRSSLLVMAASAALVLLTMSLSSSLVAAKLLVYQGRRRMAG